MGRISFSNLFGGGGDSGGRRAVPAEGASDTTVAPSSPYETDRDSWPSASVKSPPPTPPTTFAAEGLSKVLPDGRQLFGGLSFSLALTADAGDLGRPDVLVLRGPSGAGKTTLLRGLAQLEPFTTGHLHLGDRCVAYTYPPGRPAPMVA
jgi:ABC-type transport system involved in cytochrome bd biosynthesis fused ATPase/permease subunit